MCARRYITFHRRFSIESAFTEQQISGKTHRRIEQTKSREKKKHKIKGMQRGELICIPSAWTTKRRKIDIMTVEITTTTTITKPINQPKEIEPMKIEFFSLPWDMREYEWHISHEAKYMWRRT